MPQLFFIIIGIGICLFICGFAGRAIKTTPEADREYAKVHNEAGKFLLKQILTVIAIFVAILIGALMGLKS